MRKKKKLESAVRKIIYKNKGTNEYTRRKRTRNRKIIKNKETMTKTYKTFMIAKFELKQYGIGMDDMNMFVKSVVGISKENYDPVQILAKIADYENLRKI